MPRRFARRQTLPQKLRGTEHLKRQVQALYGVLASVYGQEALAARAAETQSDALMRSPRLRDRILALQRLVGHDGQTPPADEADLSAALEAVEDRVADLIARKNLTAELERRVQERLEEQRQALIRELRLELLREAEGVETPLTERKLQDLERLDRISLARSVLEQLRPRTLGQVVGQERAIRALLSKLAVPFPQHVILYGPPGVGKTTVARLVLEAAKRMRTTPFGPDAPFVEVDGSALRWDGRDATDPLLGAVHDPIYLGGRRDLAESGIPEPKLGLVTKAHGGVLFIDEIGELDPILQAKLLKVLEDKRVFFESAYYDPSDPHLPQYVRRLFERGAPADFILIGATTREPDEISPMIRSRCAEIFFDPLSPEHIRRIVRQAARRLGVEIARQIPDLISEYTVEGRKAVNLLADAYGMALHRRGGRGRVRITREDLLEVVRTSRLALSAPVRGQERTEVGRAFALGVVHYVGSIIEIEASAFPAARKGQGTIRFNETAGTMAKDAVFNAASVLRRMANIDIAHYDLHVNVVGGGLIDGPSAGLAMLVAMMSAIQQRPLRQDVAMTGEVSIQGKVRQVGAIPEKLYGARQAGMRKVLIPAENAQDVGQPPRGLEVVPVATAADALPHVFAK
ncbi:MAG: Lon family ATP-dependent protease [Armatimonadota bacterium]|nr:Lon family ATP-dependent protease [Armatimonadota bacterium]MDR7448032.1 Lon family ATP-dependent protease [Armatimonadota bacterium]MDR7459581.1 Lon family ATP-dependent protease [Armatimonadota bacterium]MDR7478626.1 Lon family ATP-dependent protease [Armatimonadota bacterium]MDR7488021.1 Lon family ATP-dependent protease [Armatimonadota bacterium]